MPETVVVPKEMQESEGLVVRQARALVISSVDDYKAAGEFLNGVIVAGERAVRALFDPHVERANAAHKALTGDRAKHLEPWLAAKRLVTDARALFARQEDARRAAVARERQEEAERIERDRLAAEADAVRIQAEAEAERLRNEAMEIEEKRLDEENRLTDEALAAGCDHPVACLGAAQCTALRSADEEERALIAKRREDADRAAREAAEELEQRAVQVEAAGVETAAAIAEEPVHVAVIDEPEERLGGVARAWKCRRDSVDLVAFVLWIAEDAPERVKYLSDKAPNWTLLDAEAKAHKKLFRVGGITASQHYGGRAGK